MFFQSKQFINKYSQTRKPTNICNKISQKILPRHGGFVLEPNVLLLRSIDHLLLSRPFSALKLTSDKTDPNLSKNENLGSLKNGSSDAGSLKVESALLASTANSPLLSNLLKLASNSTEESYAKHLEEEIERKEGCLVISDSEERVAVNVEKEKGLKAEEAASGETVLAGMIQAVWQFNSSTASVLT